MTESKEELKPYNPCAVHYTEQDVLEYVQRDVSTVAQTATAGLDVLLDMDTREPIGWRIYGWSRISRPAPLPAQEGVREKVARLAWFMVGDDLSVTAALSPMNDAHWEHWKGQEVATQHWAFADEVLSALSLPASVQGERLTWLPEDIELVHEAVEECRPWGGRRNQAATEAAIATSNLSPEKKRAYRARNEQVDRIRALLPPEVAAIPTDIEG